MPWLLRATGGLLLVWALAFCTALDLLVGAPPTPMATALAHMVGAAYAGLAVALVLAAGQTPANRPVIFAAITVLLLKTAADLYQLLILFHGGVALLSLADLVLSVGLAVGIIEALPSALRDEPKPL